MFSIVHLLSFQVRFPYHLLCVEMFAVQWWKWARAKISPGMLYELCPTASIFKLWSGKDTEKLLMLSTTNYVLSEPFCPVSLFNSSNSKQSYFSTAIFTCKIFYEKIVALFSKPVLEYLQFVTKICLIIEEKYYFQTI